MRSWLVAASIGALMLGAGLRAQVAPPAPGTAQLVPPTAAASWLHEGSDIPADPAWTTGTLPNGVRWAVRKGTTPPGTIAMRVRIDAGALMETPEQSGWAHLLEHMVFRGTATRPDGEAIKLWQRLGASFGSDTNASTTLRATSYQLDVPRNDARSLDEAAAALADMMQNARIDPKLLEIERKVVMAERVQRIPPVSRKVQDAAKPLFYAGLLAAERDIGGTEASLAAASAPALQAFYDRWYRPERAVVVLVGDADPAVLAAAVERHFAGWKARGPAPAEPAYGAPVNPAASVATVADRLLPASVQLAWVTPHEAGPRTAARQRSEFLEEIALRVVNQRLSDAALAGGAMLGARVGRSRSRNVADQVTLSVSPRPDVWAAALVEAQGVVNRTIAGPIDPAEIAQQVVSVGESLRRSVGTSATTSSAALANTFLADVDAGDVGATRAWYADLFDAQKPAITPEALQAVLKRLFAPEPRMLLLAPVPIPVADATAALTRARAAGGGAQAAVRSVTVDQLSPPRTPGAVASRRTLAEFGIERVTFANGVELTIKRTDFAKEQVSVEVRIGRGVLGRAPNTPGLDWSGAIMPSSGLGAYSAPEIARLLAGRQIGFGLSPGTDGLYMATATNPRDLPDALRLQVAGVTTPRFDPVALSRYKDGFAATYRSTLGSPGSVFATLAAPALYGGDQRFRRMPTPREVSGVTLDTVRRYWTQELAAGPIRISVVGDVDSDAVVSAVAASWGALPPRPATPLPPANLVIPQPAARPTLLTHGGDTNQAVVALAWRVPGALEDLVTARALSVATAIIQTRLTDEFRGTEGGSYSPFVTSSDLRGVENFGQIVAGAQLRPDQIAPFRATLTRILTDIATNGAAEDALARAKETQVGSAQRALSGNAYWLSVAGRNLDDPRQIQSVRTYVSGRRAVTAAQVQAVVKRYLADVAPHAIEVRPRANVIEVRPRTK